MNFTTMGAGPGIDDKDDDDNKDDCVFGGCGRIEDFAELDIFIGILQNWTFSSGF